MSYFSDDDCDTYQKNKKFILFGTFINDRRAITKGCGAELRTIEQCYMPNGSIREFDVIAKVDEVENSGTNWTIDHQPTVHMASDIPQCYGAEAASSGVISGTIGGKCEFTTGAPRMLIRGHKAIRDGDFRHHQ